MKLFYGKLTVGLVLLVLSQQSIADKWEDANLRMTEDFAIPSFEALDEAAKSLHSSADTFCETGSDEAFKLIQDKYHGMMDAWQTVQVLRSGPEELLMRSFRIQMWPDRSNNGAKQIAKLLKAEDMNALEPKKFSRSSTSVQGLSAIERILFTKDITAADFYQNGKATYRCHLLQAMTINLESMSTDMAKEWKTSYKKTVTEPSVGNDVFETHKEVSSLFLKETATQLQAVYDQKFKRPLDKRFRLKRAESWRSERSLRNIQINLESAERLFLAGFSDLISDKALKERVESEFAVAVKTGKQFKTMPLQQAHDVKLESIKRWMKQLSTLKRTVTVDVPKSLDIALGFNSMDGD